MQAYCGSTNQESMRREGSALLVFGHKLQALPDVGLAQGREPEAGASRLQRRNDLADVVADEAEAGAPGVLLDDCTRQPNAAWPPDLLTVLVSICTQTLKNWCSNGEVVVDGSEKAIRLHSRSGVTVVTDGQVHTDAPLAPIRIDVCLQHACLRWLSIT